MIARKQPRRALSANSVVARADVVVRIRDERATPIERKGVVPKSRAPDYLNLSRRLQTVQIAKAAFVHDRHSHHYYTRA